MGTAAPLPPSTDTVALDARVRAIGIDIGSTRTKVALVEIGAEVCERGIRSYPTPEDPVQLWSNIAESIRTLTDESDRPVAAIGIASMAESGVLLDTDRTPLGPIVRWDARPAGPATAPSLFESLSTAEKTRLSVATGVPPTGKVPLATWHRLAQLEPERWSKMAAWAGMADFIAERLTGELVTDHTLALRTMAYRLPRAGEDLPLEFEPEFLDLVGLSTNSLPRVLAPGANAGTVTRHAAAHTGLPPGTPVFIAGHDHVVGAWGAGARTASTLANSIGTTEALLRVIDREAPRAAALSQGMSLTRTVDGRAEIVLSGSTGGALVARWFDEHPDAGQDVLLGELDPLLSGGPFVLPYPRGRQSPFPNPQASERLIGAAESTESSFAALLAGLSLQLRWMAQTQATVLDDDREHEIVVFGGHVRDNTSWLRAKSRALGTGLGVVSADEPVAASAALLAAVRVGAVPADMALPRTTFVTASVGSVHSTPLNDRLFARFTAAALSDNPGVHP